MGSNYKISYTVDMVFCIDCTGSMDNILEIVKNNALNFYNDVVQSMSAKGKNVDKLRVRIVAFRDYIADGDNAMMVTDFFTLPDDAMNFERCVRSLVAKGGGDEPEDGLEALAYAMRSNWNTEGMKKRQIIVVWTDASTHPLGYGARMNNYPQGMAGSMQELTAWWGDKQNEGYVDQRAKRLLLFAPDKPGWSDISNNWDNVIHFPSEAGNGLKELEYGQIIATIANSI